METLEEKPGKEAQIPILGHGPSALQRRRARREAEGLVKRVRRGLLAGELRSGESQLAKPELEARMAAVDAAVAKDDHDAICDAMVRLEQLADRHLSPARKSTFREYFDSIIVAVLVALVLRAFVVEAFKIPSGSMIPTMDVGDHIFVNKFIYGLRIPFTKVKFFDFRKPKRGEVIVFIYPKDPDKDFIKRIVAVEGDAVEVRDDRVIVNGKEVVRKPQPGIYEYWDLDEATNHWNQRRGMKVQETLDGHTYMTLYDTQGGPHDIPSSGVCPQGMDLTPAGACLVPRNTVFCLGDNRYNSHDSRFWGPVPLENIKGKALVVWWSSNEPEGVKWGRIGHVIE